MDQISEVYVKTDGSECILRCEGGITTPSDLTGWTQIDEGKGDRYNLCQSQYFPGGLYTADGIPLYKLQEGRAVERTEDEIAADRLAPAKAAKIAKSKSDLETYLNSHPLTWTDGQQYSITREKQQQLTSKILSATLAAQTSTPYDLTWNSTGAECTSWALEDLAALAFAIDARVTALVSYQQAREVEIQSAQSMDELNAIEVNYDSVQ